ncbi:MAG: hypothetical protein K0Q72_4813 [Armatimonadetes bacterium]|jgi:hypothetical protein|nr:hypothetical protein [Armatimonadota bacterium]
MAEEKYRVFADERGVWREEPGRPAYGIDWDDITEVSAHKLDAMFEVCTIYTLEHPSGDSLEFNGTDEGAADVVAAIAGRLPGISADWGAQVDALSPDDDILTVWRQE